MQEEFPNRLLPKGAVRNLDALRETSAKGRTVEIVRAISSINASPFRRFGPARLRWASANSSQATDCVPASPSFSTLKDGLISRQRNYDCFDPW
jgi:hypothetical protein